MWTWMWAENATNEYLSGLSEPCLTLTWARKTRKMLLRIRSCFPQTDPEWKQLSDRNCDACVYIGIGFQAAWSALKGKYDQKKYAPK